MAEYKDSGHRPHATYTGDRPVSTRYDEGPQGLTVTLDQWPDSNNSHLFETMYRYLQSNWGDAPMTLDQAIRKLTSPNPSEFELESGNGAWPYLDKCFRGETLRQVLEGLTFWFTIDGVTRPATHQIVRTRQAAYMQHGGRDNDWRHRRFTVPETVSRAVNRIDYGFVHAKRMHCLTDAQPLIDYATRYGNSEGVSSLKHAICDYIDQGKNLYAAMVDAGIPFEDARRYLPHGLQTYIHCIYNFVSLRDTLANRLEHIMDWEYNCVAQLMVREVRMKCHPLIGKYLQSHSDRAMKAMFAGLDSWPPDGKWPNPYEVCGECGYKKSVHDEQQLLNAESPSEFPHEYRPSDSLPRFHRPEQNPFWILHPDSMAGGPIEWIPTNGTYPEELKPHGL